MKKIPIVLLILSGCSHGQRIKDLEVKAGNLSQKTVELEAKYINNTQMLLDKIENTKRATDTNIDIIMQKQQSVDEYKDEVDKRVENLINQVNEVISGIRTEVNELKKGMEGLPIIKVEVIDKKDESITNSRALKVSANTISHAYSGNEAKASLLYENRPLLISGIVLGTTTNGTHFGIWFKVDYYSVYAYMKRSQVALLSPKQKVKLFCKNGVYNFSRNGLNGDWIIKIGERGWDEGSGTPCLLVK